VLAAQLRQRVGLRDVRDDHRQDLAGPDRIAGLDGKLEDDPGYG
jgi:hypothetical protein